LSRYRKGLPTHKTFTTKLNTGFQVTIDYLISKDPNMAVDKKTLKRMQDIDKLDDNTKDKLFFLIDNVVQNSKVKKASLRKIQKPQPLAAALKALYIRALLVPLAGSIANSQNLCYQACARGGVLRKDLELYVYSHLLNASSKALDSSSILALS
jgi:hypothetical protein